ncbi:MAG: hypothetical protein LCH63_00850 [Candidatus Melainabacteria bacterium]|uniref:Uncharacterized protein n=1 Tax=Candidatus Obscuribacter phosphatis TaxID=1906157 RepID=A0A8J7P6X2_9BACT|nr:hypothetical protein [Candidatus Obscuribacter phosphatis]MCA0312368.1 hypothetical protein [Candidatus Melainabacteria bacterium]
MLTSRTIVAEILALAPDWKPVYDSLMADSGGASVSAYQLFERLGARSVFLKCLALSNDSPQLVRIIKDEYYQPMLSKMLSSNQSLKRFWSQRRHDNEFQKAQALSLAAELATKMEGVLRKHLDQRNEDGFKVLLPAYVQRSVHNAAIDYIKEEWQWEKETLQDLNLDPEQEDPRHCTADDVKYAPENRALSAEQVDQLNELRVVLKEMLEDKSVNHEPLVVVDMMFGLALTEKSTIGKELTMREVCEILSLPGETQARKIARCQVLLDKGLDMIRNRIRTRMPSVAECWQSDINVNTASRRELTHQLGLTEGEVDRLVAGRQYKTLDELSASVLQKSGRLEEIRRNGAVAAFVPVDINSCTTRDMIDILGVQKDLAQKLTSLRPFSSFEDLTEKVNITAELADSLMRRGCTVRAQSKEGEKRLDLNSCDLEGLLALGLPRSVGEKILRGRPFTTWGELEEYLAPESQVWQIIRQRSCLALFPH